MALLTFGKSPQLIDVVEITLKIIAISKKMLASTIGICQWLIT